MRLYPSRYYKALALARHLELVKEKAKKLSIHLSWRFDYSHLRLGTKPWPNPGIHHLGVSILPNHPTSYSVQGYQTRGLACWHVHRIVLYWLFQLAPEGHLKVKTPFGRTFTGFKDFLAQFEQTGDLNGGYWVHKFRRRKNAPYRLRQMCNCESWVRLGKAACFLLAPTPKRRSSRCPDYR